jgi:hypothetical protein
MEGRTTRSAQAGHSGNLYTCIDTIGGITKASTLEPWSDYAVRNISITILYAASKICYQTARQVYVNTVHRVAYNLNSLDMVHKEKQTRLLQEKVLRIEKDIRASFGPWQRIDLVSAWQAQYESLVPA